VTTKLRHAVDAKRHQHRGDPSRIRSRHPVRPVFYRHSTCPTLPRYDPHQGDPMEMTTEHPCWPDFIERLDYALTTTPCKAGQDKTIATSILKSMDVEIKSSLAYFEVNGGFCDCEILMNVDVL
jgi:hypothetical protein